MGNIFGGGFGGFFPVPPAPAPAPAPAPVPGVPSSPVIFGLQPDCFEIDTSRFNICLDIRKVNSNRLPLYQQAKDRWLSLITGHIGVRNSAPFLFGGTTIATGIPSQIDDLYIAAIERFIDGPDGILGQAGPEFTDRNDFPITGVMEFDRADVQIEINNGSFASTILHEMGHVLGIGTLVSTISVRNGMVRSGLPSMYTLFFDRPMFSGEKRE